MVRCSNGKRAITNGQRTIYRPPPINQTQQYRFKLIEIIVRQWVG
jgi:hypothetical protein